MTRSKRHGDKAYRDAQAAFVGFLERLRAYRVLDPACGSGNFLYLALKCLKDIEHQLNLEAEALGLERQHDVTGPHNVLGIELNEYAAELARVTVWIGELQWRFQRGYGFKLNPVLEALDHIECRDALMNADGSEAAWPQADVVVGNSPFVGDKKMRGELGAEYTDRLRGLFAGRVPGGADLVLYWFEKARARIEAGALQRAGLVATNSIRGGRNREVLDRLCATTRIFEAWADEPWINDARRCGFRWWRSATAIKQPCSTAMRLPPSRQTSPNLACRVQRISRLLGHCARTRTLHTSASRRPDRSTCQAMWRAAGWRSRTRTGDPTATSFALGSTGWT